MSDNLSAGTQIALREEKRGAPLKSSDLYHGHALWGKGKQQKRCPSPSPSVPCPAAGLFLGAVGMALPFPAC
jgi:hypothetical protein